MVIQKNMYDAKAHLSKFGKHALAGGQVVKLVPLSECFGKRIPGSAKGQFTMKPGFEDPLIEIKNDLNK